MLRNIVLVFTILAGLMFLPRTTFADSYEITIRVTGADGKPVEGAIASLFWENRAEGQIVDEVVASEDKRAVTNNDGNVKMRIDNWKRKRSVMIQSADGTQTAIVQAGAEDHERHFEVTLAPSVTVTGKLTCDELDDIGWTNTVVSPGPKREDFLIQNFAMDGSLKFGLPPGQYTLFLYGTHVLQQTTTIDIPAGKATYDLGEIPMLMNPKKRLIGKPAPALTIAEARGFDFEPTESQNKFDLERYRGKWVLLEFWGHW
jgi:hypothetical protein